MKTAIIVFALACLVIGTLASERRNVELANCDVCQLVAKIAESYVRKDTTKAKVLGFLKKACKITARFQQQCEQIIDTKGSALIDKILAKENPALLCEQIKLCNKPAADALFALTQLPMADEIETAPAPPPTKTCSLCEFFVKTVESYVASNATETKILEFIETVCDISGPYAAQCKAIVDAKGPEIIAFILKKENPQMLCSQLTLCAKPSVEPMFSLAGGLCPECEFVVQMVESYVSKNTTEKQIIGFLDKACALAPSPYNAECKAIVDSEGPKLLEDLIKKESPEKVCEQIKLCPKPSPSPAPTPSKTVEVEAFSDGLCSGCEFVIKTVEGYVSSNSTEKEILAFLEGACKLAGPYAATCVAAVEAKGPQVINWIIQKENPEAVCSQLTLCPKTPAPKPAVELN